MRYPEFAVIRILESLVWLKSGKTKKHKDAFKSLLYLFNDATKGRYGKGIVEDLNGYIDENDPKFKNTIKLIIDTLC